MPHSRVLITGFEPFASATRNPSESVVNAVAASFETDELMSAILPVEYAGARQRLEHVIDQHGPTAWLGFGLSQRAAAITLEELAVNLDDATIADNAGELRRGHLIDPDGPENYRSTLPLDAIAAELLQRGIPTVFSDSAGRFVCNHVFYHALSMQSRTNVPAMAGFIHLPWPSDWDQTSAAAHSVTLATMVEAAKACISTILREIRRENILAT